MTDDTNFPDRKADTDSDSDRANEKPDHPNPQSSEAGSQMKDDGSTEDVTDGDGTPIDNPAG